MGVRRPDRDAGTAAVGDVGAVGNAECRGAAAQDSGVVFVAGRPDVVAGCRFDGPGANAAFAAGAVLTDLGDLGKQLGVTDGPPRRRRSDRRDGGDQAFAVVPARSETVEGTEGERRCRSA